MLEETTKQEFNKLCTANKVYEISKGLRQYGMRDEAKDILTQFNDYVNKLSNQYPTREVGVDFKEEMLKHWYQDNVKKYETHLNYSGA